MDWYPVLVIFSIFILESHAVRLHKLFQFLDGFKSIYNLRGYLHLGRDYAVFLRAPKPHDKYLIYELYEAKKIADAEANKPKILAISKVPINYIKEQLRIYRRELYEAKHVDKNVVPGTEVISLREWQIDQVFSLKDDANVVLQQKPVILRSIV